MTACCVPHCRNKSKLNWGRYICGPHWRQVPKRLKRRLSRVRRLLIRKGWGAEGKRSWWLTDDRGRRPWDRAWAACERAAIRAATGL